MYIKFQDQTTYLDVVQLDNSFAEIPDTRVLVLTSQASVKTRDSEDALVITGVQLPAAVIKYGLLVDASNTPFASLQAAYAYVATLFTKYLNGLPSTGGGGGGGGATSANQTTQINLETVIRDNVLRGKLARIKNADDYNTAYTYHDPADKNSNITTVVHNGNSETVTETLTYVDVTKNGSNLLTVTLS